MRDFEGERDRLLAECLAAGARLYEGDRAKIYSRELSPGCLLCAEGTWSCLFVNHVCPKSCFFCPYDQSRPRLLPYTPAIPVHFADPADYARALRAFGYRGVGFSGGDPLVTLDRLLDYVRHVRRALGPDGYLWMYTNGDLLSEEKARRLADAGIDEIRVDLAARGYDLTPLRTAAKRIKNIVVETPAIPEDLMLWPSLLPKLEALGVRHLNLHQLMQTPQNAAAFAARGYAAAGPGDAERPVADSEIAALEILRLALADGSSLAVNYCSHLYKRRYQERGHRARINGFLAGTGASTAAMASITPAGVLRRLLVSGVSVSPSRLDSPSLDGRLVRAAYQSWRGLSPESFETAEEIRKAEIAPGLACYFRPEGPERLIPLRGRSERARFKKLFIDAKGSRAAAPATADADWAKKFEGLEFLPQGLPRLTPGGIARTRSAPSDRRESHPTACPGSPSRSEGPSLG